MGIGFPELLVILLIVLVIFGAGKLPQIGDALGRSIKNFKKATKDEEVDVSPRQVSPEAARPSLPPAAVEPAPSDATKQSEHV